MVVRRLSIVGQGVETVSTPESEKELYPQPPASPPPPLLSCHRSIMSARDECLLLMVVCNTVQVETTSEGSIKYPLHSVENRPNLAKNM